MTSSSRTLGWEVIRVKWAGRSATDGCCGLAAVDAVAVLRCCTAVTARAGAQSRKLHTSGHRGVGLNGALSTLLGRRCIGVGRARVGACAGTRPQTVAGRPAISFQVVKRVVI